VPSWAPPAAADAPAGSAAASQRFAGYLLDEQIGLGGMAVVYRATDERLGRRVALKLLAPALAQDAGFRQRFIRESRAAAAVDHPNIIPIYEAGEVDGALFIAMRYVHGGDVRSLLERENPLSPGRVWSIVSQVASALDAAHSFGLVHRDVKPGNMLLDASGGRGWGPAGQSGHVYLSDFGISKQQMATAALTQTGQFVGTLDYIAPEQIENQQIDGRADQYSLACAAFELLSGTRPFRKDTQLGLITAHLSDPPPQVSARRPGLPPAVDQVLADAMAKAPGQRYATCAEFAAELGRSLGLLPGAPEQARRASPPSPPARPPTEVAQPALGLAAAAGLRPDVHRPATGGSPPGPGGGWPSPPPASTGKGRRWVAAATAAAAAVVIGGGATAAVLLTHHNTPSAPTSLQTAHSSSSSSSSSPAAPSNSPSTYSASPAVSPPPVVSTPSPATSTPAADAAAANREAHAVNDLLITGENSSEVLSSAETDAKNCASLQLAADVDQIQAVRDQRQTELDQAQLLNTSDLPNGTVMKGNLINALSLSLQSDGYYLTWAQRQAQPDTCANDSQPPEEPAADIRAHAPKEAFLQDWNPIARQYGLPERSRSQM